MTTLIQNKKIGLQYEIIEKYEAGIQLTGQEVKSLRNGKGSFEGAHALVRGGEVFLVNADIAPYQPLNTPENYDPKRTRKLLLSKKEIAELEKSSNVKGLTIAPISIYNKGRLLKVSIAVVKGKKKYDKREDIKKRDSDREVQRELKDR